MDEASLRHFMFMAASVANKNNGNNSSASKLHISKSDPTLPTLDRRKEQPARKTTVKFSTDARVFPIENRNKYTKKQRASIWYSKDEINDLKRETFYEHTDCLTVMGCPNLSFASTQPEIDSWVGIHRNDEDRCVRGLEGFLCDTYNEERSETTAKIVSAVLTYQQEQASQSVVVDAEMLRLVAVKVSRPSRRIARMLAKADEKVVAMSREGGLWEDGTFYIGDESSGGGTLEERETESIKAPAGKTKRRHSWGNLLMKNPKNEKIKVGRTASAGQSKPKKSSFLKSKLQKMIGTGTSDRVPQ